MNKENKIATALNADQEKITSARHHDPFVYLGLHRSGSQACLRMYAPHTQKVDFGDQHIELARLGDTDFFEWKGESASIGDHELLTSLDDSGRQNNFYDPYSFAPQIADFDLHLDQVLDTMKKRNIFLETATGFTSKQRLKMLKDKAKKLGRLSIT